MSEQRDDLDDDLSGEDPSEEELAEGAGQKKFSGKKLVLFVGLPVLVLALGGGGAWIYFSGKHEAKARQEAVAAAKEPTQTLYYDLPEMLVNLNTGGRKASYLKVKVSLEVDRQSALKELQAKLPRVIDDFQVYLRELRLEDLNGSAGMFRLKEELLRRVNTSLYPTKVKDVLFKEMLVQ